MSWNGVQMTADRGLEFQIDVPPEMTEGMTLGGALAPRISRKEALQVPAVIRSRNLIAGTLATLPIHIRDRQRRIATPTTLLEQINPDVPNVVTIGQTYEDLLFEAVSWWRVLEFGWHGYPTFAEHVDPSRVAVYGDQVYIDGRPINDDRVIRFDSPNPPLLVHAARAIRACLRLDTTAATYAEEPVPLGYFTPKEGARIRQDDPAIQKILDQWNVSRRNRAWGFLGAALELKSLQFNAEQIQLSEQRQHAVLEIARACGIDPEDLGVHTTSRTYQNSEERRQDRIDFTLRPYVSAFEQRLSMGDVTPRGYEVKVNFDGFLRASTKTRFEAHEIALKNGFETLDEVRALEDRPPLTPAEERELKPAPPVTPETNGNGALRSTESRS